jgi:hypothetical protein
VIRMTHHEHGVTHVYTDSELAERLKLGWKAEKEGVVLDEAGAEVAFKPPVPEVPVATTEQAKRKPGRPRKVQ